MNKYISRVTSSARGENFNPLVWPFLLATLAYGTGFALFGSFDFIWASSLFQAMSDLGPLIPTLWGVAALTNIVLGLTFLLFNIPPLGRVSGLIGFMLWVFASFCWILTGGWFVAITIGIPNMYFWFWQYLSLSHFRKEDALDRHTMECYDAGEYDDELNPEDAKADRENNRGVEWSDGHN